ncbi:hypothetical protein [Jeotgalibacillus sp. R-1-5s-1]|uniref:hypothetical protein n=1 Tax=Jeotgalibacillus sp. R-1-5s-1 TaxID=2555897 RepID=UPI00106CE502|nr:hypothetical protein [Jeotgalibacillus sp. R-1-5s-1]TFE03357.1 hypothetical protein E2491_00785 [Jeotgalibacillus sp. R-1-5s-1]
MVKIMNIVATAAGIGLLNILLMLLLNTGFIEISLLAGIIGIVVVRFFTSPGNYAKANRAPVETGLMTVQLKEQKKVFYPKTIEWTSIVYTAVSLAAVIVLYRDYFFT